jgi:hypothetical protein
LTIFDTAADTLFSDDNLAVDATYTPVVGSPVSVKAILEHDVDLMSVGGSNVTDRQIVIGIRKSEVALPGRNDTVQIGASTYTVDSIVDDDDIVIQVVVH